MYKISTDIYNSVKNSTIIITEVEIEKRNLILKSVQKKYISTNKGYRLWERFNDYEYTVDCNGWAYIKDYVSNNKCIMFFNTDEETVMFYIRNGKDLYFILSETSGYEFYITNEECSYLICFNHHDILYGCGDAIIWVKSLKILMQDR